MSNQDTNFESRDWLYSVDFRVCNNNQLSCGNQSCMIYIYYRLICFKTCTWGHDQQWQSSNDSSSKISQSESAQHIIDSFPWFAVPYFCSVCHCKASCHRKKMIIIFIIKLTLLLTAYIGCVAQIQFINEPQDVCITEGENGFFPCTYAGTVSVPKWTINHIKYSASTLPPQHFYNGSGLIVARVTSSMNMYQYTCLFDSVVSLLSNTAHLTVVQSKSSKWSY